jgi:hypothetical protein
MCRKFPVQRKTLNLKVPYYVKENFHTEYQGSLRRLEITVEEEYVTNLRHSCYREKNYRKYTWMNLFADAGSIVFSNRTSRIEYKFCVGEDSELWQGGLSVLGTN